MPSVLAGKNYKLTYERDYVTVSSLYPEPDPDWTFVDAAGHRHDGSGETLEWVFTRTYWCEECCDEHEEGEWRCLECGEVLVPGTRTAQDRQLPGLARLTLEAEWSDAAGWVCHGTWVVRPDEMKTFPADEGERDAWVERIRERDPDSLVVRGGA